MKIIFYDIKNQEFDYLTQNMFSTLEPYFMKCALNEATYVDEKFLNAQAICVFVSSVLTAKVLAKFKNLKYIFLRSTGYSNVDLKFCKENNIQVFNVPNYGSSSVAEYAFSLILSLSRKINKAKMMVQKGIIEQEELIGFDLFNKTIGIIGFGSIGRKILNIAHGFAMDVLIYDVVKKGAYNFVELNELLENSDIVVLSCPLNPQTMNLINKDTISKMKKTSLLINVARGEIVNTKDLYFALVNNKIQGAGLDVIECEEVLCQAYKTCQEYSSIKQVCLKKYFFIQKLLQLPNVIITPHNAYNTKEANKKILDTTLFNIKQMQNIDSNPSVKNLVLI